MAIVYTAFKMLQEGHGGETFVYCGENVLFHFTFGMVAKAGVDMVISGNVYSKRFGHVVRRWSFSKTAGEEEEKESGIAPWKEMDNPIDIGSITDITHFHFKIKEFFYTSHFHGIGRAVGQMINNRADFGEVYWIRKNSFHITIF